MKLYFNYHKQLVRVDNIKEFYPLLFDRQITDFFLSQKFLIARGEQAKPIPFRHIVSKEIFELLLLKLNQKVGFKNTLCFDDYKGGIDIITGDRKDPCIIIESEV